MLPSATFSAILEESSKRQWTSLENQNRALTIFAEVWNRFSSFCGQFFLPRLCIQKIPSPITSIIINIQQHKTAPPTALGVSHHSCAENPQVLSSHQASSSFHKSFRFCRHQFQAHFCVTVLGCCLVLKLKLPSPVTAAPTSDVDCCAFLFSRLQRDDHHPFDQPVTGTSSSQQIKVSTLVTSQSQSTFFWRVVFREAITDLRSGW